MPSKRNIAARPHRRADRRLYRLEVSAYDRVAGMLISLLLLVGLAVSIMFIVWLTNRIFLHHTPPAVLAADIFQPEDPWGGFDEIEPPPPAETATDVEQTIDAVIDAVAARATMLQQHAAGEGSGRGGTGMQSRRKGKSRHWEVQFIEGNTLQTYARQLDFFKIELGVLRPSGQIEYASGLSTPSPQTRTGTTEQENRYYLSWRRGNLKKADVALLRRAGIEPGRSPILKFLTPEVEARLVGLEKVAADERANKINMTRFGLLPDGEGYKFYVMRQTYR